MFDMFPHSITFQEKKQVSDGGGGYTESWVDAFSSDAHVQPITGNTRFQAQQLETPINTRVYIPSNQAIKSSMRIVWHDRNDTIITLKSDPIDQGGLGENSMIEGVM